MANSRNEDILLATINGTEYNRPPLSREEALFSSHLLQLLLIFSYLHYVYTLAAIVQYLQSFAHLSKKLVHLYFINAVTTKTPIPSHSSV